MTRMIQPRSKCWINFVSCFLCISLLFFTNCSTAWKQSGSYYRTTTTNIAIDSVPQGKLYIDNNYVGNTPIIYPVQYEEQVQKKTRKVSYWVTQPGWSLLLSICTLGIYIPFSLIPVDIETSLEPTASFRNNGFNIQIESEGYTTWQKKLFFAGEDKFSIDTTLERKGGAE